MAKGNGQSGRDLLVDLLQEVRDVQRANQRIDKSLAQVTDAVKELSESVKEMRKAQLQAVSSMARMAGTVEALIETVGEYEAELDEVKRRVAALEDKIP